MQVCLQLLDRRMPWYPRSCASLYPLIVTTYPLAVRGYVNNRERILRSADRGGQRSEIVAVDKQ